MNELGDALDALADALDSSALLAGAVIVVAAWICQQIVRHFIKRTVRGLQGDKAQRGLHLIRKSTPKAFLNTGQYPIARRSQRAETIGAILRSASTIVIAVIAFFMVLAQFGAKLGPYIAGTAVATAALGFGAQYIVRDFLAGFFIVVEDQYGVGDKIEVDEVNGTVESVSLRITRIRDRDGRLWHIPNGEIKRVGNKSQSKVSPPTDLLVPEEDE